MRVPATLYMYCPPKAVRLLWDRRFKATSPHQLNDPFEFDPPIIGRASETWLRKHFSQPHRLREVYRRTKPNVSFAEYVRREEESGAMSAKALHGRQENVRAEAKKGLRTKQKELKVICLSANPSDALCWALYTEKHCGFVIGIDSSRINPLNLEKVRYSKTRPSINLKTALVASPDEKNKLWRKIVRTKSPEWRHEREYRLIFSTGWADPETDSKGNEVDYRRFQPSLINEVIFGSRCSNESEIRNALMDPVFRKVNKFRAHLNERNFGIQIKSAETHA